MPDRTRHRPWRRIPPVVLAAVVAFGALAATWSVATPLFEAPDEPHHLALVLHLADGNPYPAYDGLRNPASTYAACGEYAASMRLCPVPGQPPEDALRLHPADEAPPRSDRPAWNDGSLGTRVGRTSQMPQHPPLYYQAMASVLRVERALNGGRPRAIDQELALLRLVNALLIAPLPLLAWWGARRFGLDDPTAAAAALVVFAVPMLTHIGSTLNNDNLLTLVAAGLAALLAGVARGDRTRRTAVAVGVLAGLGLLTKAFAIVFPPLIVLAYLVGARQRWSPPGAPAEPMPDAEPAATGDLAESVTAAGAVGAVDTDRATGWRQELGGLVPPLVLAGVATLLVAAWWYVGLRLRSGEFAPSVEDEYLTTALREPGFRADHLDFLGRFVELIEVRFWGSYGSFSLTIPTVQAHVLTVLVVAAVASAVATRATPGAVGRPASRVATWSLLAPLAALLVFVELRAWDLHRTTGRYLFIQGRYLFAGVVGLALVVAMGVRRAAGRWSPLVVAAVAVVVQVDGLRRVLQVYWGGPGVGPRGQVRALLAWGGLPVGLVATLWLATVASGAGLAWQLLRWHRAGAEPGAGRPVGSIAP